MNLFEFVDICSIKENDVKFLQNKGILHTERICECGSEMLLKLSEKGDQFSKIQGLGKTGKVTIFSV